MLVDPASEEQGRRYTALDPATKTLNDQYVAWLHSECIPVAAKGFYRSSDIFTKCVGGPDAHFSAQFNDAVAENNSTAVHFQAVWSEGVNVFRTSSDQVRAARRLSTQGVNRVVPGAGHYIQFDRPEAVVGAVLVALDELRAPSATAGASGTSALQNSASNVYRSLTDAVRFQYGCAPVDAPKKGSLQ